MARFPRFKKRTFVIAAGIVFLSLIAAGFLFHILPEPDTLGNYIEVKATPANIQPFGSASAPLALQMNRPLIADYAGEPDTDYSPLTIRFFDMSRGTPGAWQWDFGDGTSSTDRHPVHEYRQPGIYNVTLIVTRDDGSRRVAVHEDILGITKPAGQTVHVDTLRQGFLKKGSSITFLSGNGNSFCTMNGINQQIPEGLFAKLRVNTDDAGMISIRQGNLLRFDFSDATLFVDGIQAAQGLSGDCILPSSRYLHANLTYAVIPTEGTVRQLVVGGKVIRADADNSEIVIVHDSSDKNADLTLVTYPAYFEGSAITFSLQPSVIATFTISPAEGNAPLNVSFRDESAGSPTSWAWDFGDGTRSGEQHPVHRYLSPGSYTVSLTVRNGDRTDTLTKPNAVVALPERLGANFTAFPLNGPVPLKVKFTDKSGGSPWQWSWGVMTNGSSGTVSSTTGGLFPVLHDQNPVMTFTEPGVYSVWLAVSTVYGTSEVVMPRYITVIDPYRIPDKGILIQTGKKGYITKDSCIQFTVSEAPATIGMNGGYRDLPKGALVRIEARSDQQGEIYMDKGQLLKFAFPDMALYIDGDLVAVGKIESIYVPHMTGFETALVYYLTPASAYTKVDMSGYNVLGDLDTAWIRVENLGMDSGGNLRLVLSENRTYISGAANQTVHDWIVE
jgi:PKD repeat protein